MASPTELAEFVRVSVTVLCPKSMSPPSSANRPIVSAVLLLVALIVKEEPSVTLPSRPTIFEAPLEAFRPYVILALVALPVALLVRLILTVFELSVRVDQSKTCPLSKKYPLPKTPETVP